MRCKNVSLLFCLVFLGMAQNGSSQQTVDDATELRLKVSQAVELLGSDKASSRYTGQRDLNRLGLSAIHIFRDYHPNCSAQVLEALKDAEKEIRSRRFLRPSVVSGEFFGSAAEVLQQLSQLSGTTLPEVADTAEVRLSFTFEKLPFWYAVIEVLGAYSLWPVEDEKRGWILSHTDKKPSCAIVGPLVFFVQDISDFTMQILCLLEQRQRPPLQLVEKTRFLSPSDRTITEGFFKIRPIRNGDALLGYLLETPTRIQPPFSLEMRADYRIQDYLDDSFSKAFSLDPFRFVAEIR